MQPSVNELLQQEPEQVQLWLERVWSGREEVPPDFNWLLLAEGAAFNAVARPQLQSRPPDLQWGRVAAAVYDHLAGQSAQESARHSLQCSSMNLRAALIKSYGAVPGDPVLDADRLRRWFFANLTMSPEEAARKAASWRDCDLEDIRTMRRIKSRLAILEPLWERGLLERTDELDAWFALKDQLP
jgi:hypothetical protein